jgi:hypothetical protein
MGPICSSAETQVCHRSYIIAASVIPCVILVPHIDSRVKIIDNERGGVYVQQMCIYLHIHNTDSWVFPVTDQCYVLLNFSSIRFQF